MAYDQISLNGRLTTWQQAELNPTTLLGRNWVYTTVYTVGHRPLHLKAKLNYLLDSYKALFGTKPNLSAGELAQEIHNLLYFGLYPEGGNTLNVYLIPSETGATNRLIVHEATTPYDSYALLTVRPIGTIANYEIPFEKHHTSVSMTAARFADNYAAERGAGVALRANRAGTLLSSGDNPLFALRGFTLLANPIGVGARPSAERDLMFRTASLAGVNMVEEELRVEDLEQYDELLVFTPVGLQSIARVGDMVMVNIYANRLAKALTTLTREGFAL